MNSQQSYSYLQQLIMKIVEGAATEEEIGYFKELLRENSDVRKFYLEFIGVHSGLRHIAGTFSVNQSPGIDIAEYPLDRSLLKALLEEESTAPAIERPREEPQPTPTKKPVTQTPQKINKLSLFAATLSTAVLLFIVLVINFAPHQADIGEDKVVVAQVSQAVDAEWLEVSAQITVGSDLYPGPLILKKGLAEVTMVNGAQVLLEAPVEIELESSSGIYLRKGRLVANIENSNEDRFIVRTANATVVDFGTEFGVEVDPTGQTHAHVFQGEVELRQGSDPLKYDGRMQLEAGQAGMVKTSGELERIDTQPERFVSAMPTRYERAVKKSKPLDYWRFDRDGKGQLRNEKTAGFNDGYNLFGSLEYVDGPKLGGDKPNRALRFPGVRGHYIVLHDKPEAYQKAEGLSIAMWIRPEAPRREQIIIMHGNKTDDTRSTDRVFLTEDNRVNVYVFCHTVKDFVEISSNPIPLQQWTHVAVTYTDKDMLNLYINGNLAARQKLTGEVETYPFIDCWYVGSGAQNLEKNFASDPKSFAGSIDEISHYGRELSAQEVRTLYEAASR